MRTLFLVSATLLACAAFAPDARAQCNIELFMERSMQGLDEGYIFEKSYRIDGKQGDRPRLEYVVFLSRGTNYKFSMSSADGGATGLTMALYDGSDELVATNYVNEKFFTDIKYRCNATGLYTLKFTFSRDSQNFCGAAVLAFRR